MNYASVDIDPNRAERGVLAALAEVVEQHPGGNRCVLNIKLSVAPFWKKFELAQRCHPANLREAIKGVRGCRAVVAIGPHDREEYEAYLASQTWRALRTRLISERGNECQRCGNARPLQLHHLSYDRLGYEQAGDLRLLCGNCHTNADRERHWAARVIGFERASRIARTGTCFDDEIDFEEAEERFEAWLEEQESPDALIEAWEAGS